MKLLKPLCFVVGMTGMFSMTVPHQLEWLTTLPSTQASALAIAVSLALATALTWLTQFRRRHIGSPGLLAGFAACGLLVAALVPAQALTVLPDSLGNPLSSIARLALCVLFCLIATRTQPASEYAEGAE
jgi:hypothetical protein